MEAIALAVTELSVEDSITALYIRYTRGDLPHHHTSYFPQLSQYFQQTTGLSRVHSLEMILGILHEGKWPKKRLSDRPTRIDNDIPRAEAKQRESIDHLRKIAEEDLKETWGSNKRVPLTYIMGWVEKTIPTIEDQACLITFFLFVTTHYTSIRAQNDELGQRFLELHRRMWKNEPKYAKLLAFERLNQEAFSPSYRPLK